MKKWFSIVLTIVIGIWTSPDALALTASPSSLTFQAIQGGSNPASQYVNVSKSNSKSTNWTASDSAAWLSVSPLTGGITNTAQVGVTVNIAGLAAGTYSATVSVTVSKGGNISIPVTLTVASTTTTTSPPTTTSTSASLSWSPPDTTTVVAGYKVYMGNSAGVYGPPVVVGNVTSYVINNLAVGTYYFVVTDYDSTGTESLPSNEVSTSIY
jgi:hypothetical protein